MQTLAWQMSKKGFTDEMWLWNTLYATSNITVAATLFWQYMCFIYHEKKVKKIWQEENR